MQESVIGREQEVRHLCKLIKSPGHKPVAVTGMAGVGKTTLAIHCACSSDLEIENIAFINAQSIKSFEGSVRQIAQGLEIKTGKRELKDIMREIFHQFTTSSLLLIYDNIDDYSVVKDYLPENFPNLYILATSQLTELKSFFQCYQLEVLSPEASEDLVLSVLCLEDPTKNTTPKDLQALVSIFGGLPLGLQLAAAHIKDIIHNENNEYTIQDYIKKYNQYLNKPFPDDFKVNYKHTVYIALLINIEKIKHPDTKEMLWCMSYVNPDQIWPWIFNGSFSENQVNKAIRELTKYSILKKGKPESLAIFTIHRMLQEICRLYKQAESKRYLILTTKVTLRSRTLDEYIPFIFSHMENQTIIDILTESFLQDFGSSIVYKHLVEQLPKIKYDISLTKRWSLWHFYCFSLYIRVIKKLKEKGLLYEHKNYNWTPFHAVVLNREGYIQLDSVLNYLKYIPNVKNAQTETGLTAVHIAAALDFYCNLEKLINLGCDVNIQDNEGDTPLHWAARNKCCHAIQMLIKYDAILIKNNKGELPFDILNKITYEKSNIIYSQAYIVIEPTSPCGGKLEKQFISWDIFNNIADAEHFVKTKLKKCSWWNIDLERFKHEYTSQVEELISAVHAAPLALELLTKLIVDEDWTLEQALEVLHNLQPHTELETFMSFCSDTKYKTTYYVICLILDKLEREHPTSFKYFSYMNYCGAYGASQDADKPASCVGVPERKLKDCFKLLQKYGLVTIDHPCIHPLVQWILHVYFQKRSLSSSTLEEILKLSLDCKYEVIKRVLSFMCEKDIYEFCKKEYEPSDKFQQYLNSIRSTGIKITTDNWSALHYACSDHRFNSQHTIYRLKELKVDVNLSINGISPIHLASFRNSGKDCRFGRERIEDLTEYNVNVNVQTNEGLTPLHLAAFRGEFHVASDLLCAGADMNAIDSKGDTPAHYAARFGHTYILQELIKEKADMNAVNVSGETPNDLLKKYNIQKYKFYDF